MDTEKTFSGVTLHGLPVQIDMQWPFHRSEGGSDWYVLHGRLVLADGGPLHADVALNVSQTVREALPALDGELAFWVSVNTARKALDDKQLELLKSGKRQPVAVSSRSYSIRRQQFTFWTATPQQIEAFLARKVFWVGGSERRMVTVADLCDAQYLGASDPSTVEKFRTAANALAARGLIELAGNSARATDALIAQAAAFHTAKDQELDELHAKHAFERA